jgi:hypothetical protein
MVEAEEMEVVVNLLLMKVEVGEVVIKMEQK